MTVPEIHEQPLPFPAELTIEIFQIAISVDLDSLASLVYQVEEDSDILSRFRGRQTTPLTLGAVCRSWRSLVLGTPTLWSTITINFPNENYGAQLEILAMWLSNSAMCPLTITSFSLSRTRFGYYEWDGIPPSALEILVEHSARWEQIGLGSIDAKCVNVLQRIDGRIPSLRTLHFRLGFGCLRLNIDIFRNAPLLRRTAIAPYRSKTITLPWHQLTSFTGNSHDSECIDILTRCSNLRECHFIAVFMHPYKFMAKMDHIPLLQLHSLSIDDTFGGSMKNVIERITCPALRELRLSKPDSDLPSPLNVPYQAIDEMIVRSQCPLELLDLDINNNISQSALGSMDLQVDCSNFLSAFAVLEKLLTLKKLILRDRCVNDTVDFFDDLIAKLNTSLTPVFLPQLTELRYISPNMVHLTKTRLVKCLRQRLTPPLGIAKLQSLIIDATVKFAHSEEKVTIETELGKLTKIGMKVSVTGIDL